MKNIDDLTESARELKERGLKVGEIADELNVSRETANWLLTHGGGDEAPPADIHLDWSAIGSSARRLDLTGAAIADLLLEHLGEPPEVVVGIAKAGVPLATQVAREFDCALAEYTPRKQKLGEEDYDDVKGSFGRNFADVEGRRCAIVDDVITSGRTMTEAIRFVEESGGDPIGAAVIANKTEETAIDGVRVDALLHIVRVE